MEKQLVFVSVYASFNRDFEQLCKEYGYPYTIIDARLDDAVLEIRRRFPSEIPSVIISRGVTAELIQSAYSSAVVIPADPDDSDLIDALEEAKKYGDRIGCLINKKIEPYNMLGRLQKLLGIDTLEVFFYENGADIIKAFDTARAHNLNVMAGGGQLGSSVGIQYGIPTVFIASGQRTIWKAVTKAWSVLEFLFREREQDIRLNAIINSMEDGVVGIRNGRLTMMNPHAERIFNFYGRQMIGKEISEINAELARFAEQPGQNGKTIRINGKHVLAERILNSGDAGDHEDVLLLHDIGHLQNMEQKVRRELYTKGLVAKYTLDDIVGANAQMRRTIEEATIYAKTDANVLISGESGTGKELLAQGIHNASRRHGAPFVAINCAELPEPLLESELFGYTEGAFTGAKRGGKIGLLELAHKGTVFLDEINSTTVALQGKLLRAIQEKQIRRIGSDSMIPVDIRFISAINVNIEKEIEAGRFRRDLYYRLNTLSLQAIPLRSRPEDIVALANHFCGMHSVECGCRPIKLTESMCALLQRARWMGNVRELDNVMHRFCVLSDAYADKEALLAYCMRDVSMHEAAPCAEDQITVRAGTLEEIEREIMQAYLEQAGGSRSAAAERLGVSRATLWRRLGTEEKNDAL